MRAQGGLCRVKNEFMKLGDKKMNCWLRIKEKVKKFFEENWLTIVGLLLRLFLWLKD